MIKIGVESHIQLNSVSKIFCSCPATGTDTPNTRTCPTCLGMPGSKPVFNKKALIQAIKVALALNCKIAPEMFFSRKSYFYPDLPKNFQITQFEKPLAEKGNLDEIGITRIHLEEDPGRLVHDEGLTLVDYNRSGTPLIEVVTEPDFKKTEEVRLFLQKLTTILEYLKVYSRKSEASIRTDANISISGGERVEVKNITGIKDIEKALNYEVLRQQNILNSGQKVERETRAWDPITKTTKLLRTKETEEDYGFITEPDLTKIEITKDVLDKIKKEIPELPNAKTQRFIKQYKINPIDAKIITSDLLLANMFEDIVKKINPILAAHWLRRELLRVLNYNRLVLSDTKIKVEHLIDLFSLVEDKKITDENAKRILEKLIIKPFSVKSFVKKQKLKVVVDEETLTEICENVIKENQKAVKDFKAGEEKAFHFLLGKIMQATKGQASPKIVNKIMRRLII